MKAAILLIALLAGVLVLSGCTQPTGCPEDARVCPDGTTVTRNPELNCEFDSCPTVECAGEGEVFSDTVNCCAGLVKAVSTCEKCKEEGEPLAFDGIPCCQGLEVVDGFCQKPRPEPACKKEGESIPVIADPPECCQGLTLIPPKEENLVGISGYCTAKCGDSDCGEIESEYNCPQDCKPATECGNGECETGETDTSCPEDCVIAECGNGECETGETESNCPSDCEIIECGDGVCHSTETEEDCPEDCEVILCGNGFCDMGETVSCPVDCAKGELVLTVVDDSAMQPIVSAQVRVTNSMGVAAGFTGTDGTFSSNVYIWTGDSTLCSIWVDKMGYTDVTTSASIYANQTTQETVYLTPN